VIEPHGQRRSLFTLPALAVAEQACRAALALAIAPLRLLGYAVHRRRYVAELSEDLATQASPPEPPPLPPLPQRPLRIFLSCAEPSGELHARSLLQNLRAQIAAAGAPPPIVFGLGGPALGDLGVERVGDPVARAAMGFGVVAALPFYLGLLTCAARALRERDPDLVIGVDSPALHVPLCAIARRYGLRTVHFVTPQYWGWAPWRVGGYRRAVGLALSILPFEPAWFERHGVRAKHVGHPLLDALADVPATLPPDASRTLVILPGSRRSVLARNLPWMVEVLAEWRLRHPDARIVLPHARRELVPAIEAILARCGASEWVHVATEPLHAVLAGARAAFSVSGTVLLDLLHHRLPTVVVYRVSNGLESFGARHLLTVPHFAAPNLLAGEAVCPEFCFHGEGPRPAVLDALTGLWADGDARATCRAGLERAAARLGPPGASRRAARWALAELARAPAGGPDATG